MLAVCTVTVSASAQSASELQRGRVLFRDGLSLEAAGDWRAALQKFEEVARIRLTPQVRFHMARTKEYLGRWTEALGDYRMAEYEAANTNALELALITEARRSLQQRVPRLVIEQEKGGGVQRLTLDGVELGQNQLGLELAVDPGRHHVVAFWHSGAELEQSIDSREGQMARLVLRPPESSASTIPAESDASGAAAAERAARRVQRVWPVLLGSLGFVGIATGAGLMVLREEAKDRLDRACGSDRNSCPESLRGANDRGELYSWLAPVVGGAGVVAVGSAVALWFASEPAPDKKGKSGAARLSLVSSTREVGVTVVGSF